MNSDEDVRQETGSTYGMTDPDVDGDLVDAIATELHHHRGPDQAITSAALAGKLGIEDSEAQPKTREAIKVCLRERGLPIVSSGSGYYIPDDEQTVEEHLESLRGRIAGIEERIELIASNWEDWVDRQSVRDAPTNKPAIPDAEAWVVSCAACGAGGVNEIHNRSTVETFLDRHDCGAQHLSIEAADGDQRAVADGGDRS